MCGFYCGVPGYALHSVGYQILGASILILREGARVPWNFMAPLVRPRTRRVDKGQGMAQSPAPLVSPFLLMLPCACLESS